MFESLETTALAIWVGESLWGYPIVLALHAVGLAIVAGFFIMLDLHLLRVIRAVPLTAFLSMFTLTWIGFVINALSGTALFTSQATTFAASTTFLIKISAVLAGVIIGILIQRQLKIHATDWDDADARVASSVTGLAVLSLTCWMVAIFAGRLTAYL